MNYVQMIILFLIIYFCVYTIIDRICRCKEACAMAKSYEKYVETLRKENDDGTTTE